MTHTSTEQPEALRLADLLEHEAKEHGHRDYKYKAADELRRQHARILELEAAQAGRVALSDAEIELAMAWGDVCEGDHVLGAFTAGVRHVEKLYGITQEKQG